MSSARYRGCPFEIVQCASGRWEWTFYQDAGPDPVKVSSNEVSGSRAHAELSLYHAIDRWLNNNKRLS